jgi:leukotriene-A4 hydrolase
MDPNSYANTNQILITHVALDLDVDFTRKILHGSVTHTAVAQEDNVRCIILDTNHLNIISVAVNNITASFSLGSSTHAAYGVPLTVELGRPLGKHEIACIKIEYETTDKCLAAQWLEPEQTVGKLYPYLFTQCQPIYARTLVPIQDTPFVKLKCKSNMNIFWRMYFFLCMLILM